MAPQSSPAGRLRITRRGRMVLALLVTVVTVTIVALSILTGVPSALASGASAAKAVEFTTVVVVPGDSLWSIASRVAPEADPRDVIADMKRLNRLHSSDVLVGQELAIPLKYSDS